MKKQRVTVWPDGTVSTVEYPEIDPVLTLVDMGEERYSHAGLPTTISVEEVERTLVVTKESGVVHVYTWSS